MPSDAQQTKCPFCGHKMKCMRFCQIIREYFFTMTVTEQWNRFSRELESPSLRYSKVIWTLWTTCLGGPAWGRRLDLITFKVPANTNHSAPLWYRNTLIYSQWWELNINNFSHSKVDKRNWLDIQWESCFRIVSCLCIYADGQVRITYLNLTRFN